MGLSGKGTFIQSGGTNALFVGLGLGDNSGGYGTYNLSGGYLYVTTGDEYVGYSGSGYFTQSGGTNAVNNSSYQTDFTSATTPRPAGLTPSAVPAC